MQFKVVDTKKWEQLPASVSAKKEDKYTPVLDALESGEILEIPTIDTKEAKGIRITIGRKSALRGFKCEYRTDGNTLYVKKSEEPVVHTAPKERKKKEKIAQPA